MKNKKNEIIPTNAFFCCGQEFTQKEVISHLKEVHSVDTSQPANRRMLSHIDGADFYGSTYEWTFGDIKVTQSVSNPRAKDDPMRF